MTKQEKLAAATADMAATKELREGALMRLLFAQLKFVKVSLEEGNNLAAFDEREEAICDVLDAHTQHHNAELKLRIIHEAVNGAA